MASLNHLADLFEKFPGIGPRQSQRFVQFLLRQPISYLNDLSETIKDVKTHSKICKKSFVYFYSEDETETLSPLEKSHSRDRNLLMVVEQDSDVENIERTGSFNGVYFVLGGTVSVFGSKTDTIRIKELLETIPIRIEEGLEEIIIATSATPEGDTTADIIRQKLGQLYTHIKVSSLARGLSTGTELEYVDRDTFNAALRRRE